jgi:hypothetical protein
MRFLRKRRGGRGNRDTPRAAASSGGLLPPRERRKTGQRRGGRAFASRRRCRSRRCSHRGTIGNSPPPAERPGATPACPQRGACGSWRTRWRQRNPPPYTATDPPPIRPTQQRSWRGRIPSTPSCRDTSCTGGSTRCRRRENRGRCWNADRGSWCTASDRSRRARSTRATSTGSSTPDPARPARRRR